jgi:hypothetical protein
MRPYLKTKQNKRAGGMAQVVKCLPSKPQFLKKKNKEGKKKKKTAGFYSQVPCLSLNPGGLCKSDQPHQSPWTKCARRSVLRVFFPGRKIEVVSPEKEHVWWTGRATDVPKVGI